MKQRIIALLLAMTLLLSLAPTLVGAAAAPSVSAGDISVTQGSYKSMSITAADFSAVGALEIALYYDSSVLSVRSCTVGSLISGAFSNVNTETPGVILLTAASPTGISGSGTLLTISWTAAVNAAPASYPIKVTIGDFSDTSLEPMTVTGASGYYIYRRNVGDQNWIRIGTAKSSATSFKVRPKDCRDRIERIWVILSAE